MAGSELGFGHVIRARRRELDLTQDEVARLVNTSASYIGNLEAGKRHPSEEVVTNLADALGLDVRELFFLANPGTEVLISQHPNPTEGTSAWDTFSKDRHLRKIHNITDQEMQTLSRVAQIGEVRSARDFVFILNSIRLALSGQ